MMKLDLDEVKNHKGAIVGGASALVFAIALIANLAQILDWLGIKPTENRYKQDPSTSVEAVIPEKTEQPEIIIHEDLSESKYIETEPIAPPEDYEPKLVRLTELDYFNSEFPLEVKNSMKDNLGQTYAEALVTREKSYGYSQYYLNKKYTQLSGTIFLVYDSRSTNQEKNVEFRGDGNTIETFTFTGGVLPQDFTLDVTDVEVLEISYSGIYGEYVGMDAYLTKAE